MYGANLLNRRVLLLFFAPVHNRRMWDLKENGSPTGYAGSVDS